VYLERLEIAGFKSFAKRTAFLFPNPNDVGSGITAVVGPNGSGKSCLLDSIRWVLGEQSLKLLRGKKSDDVIFSGSAQRAAAKNAEVTLVLNNETAPLSTGPSSSANPEIDHLLRGSAVSITRTLSRDGTSEYLLNNERARLQDITMLLARVGLGTNTYSLIGQGMIDALLLSSPKEWKEFFDDATGITPYRLKREATVRKIDSTRQNLAQAEALKNELEPQVRSLGRQMKRFERREEYLKLLEDAEFRYYGAALSQLQHEHEQATARAQQCESSLHAADAERLTREQEFERLASARGGSEMDELHQKMMELMRSREKLIMSARATATPGTASPLVRSLETVRRDIDAVADALERAEHLDEARGIAKRLRSLSAALAPVATPAPDRPQPDAVELRAIEESLATLEAEMRGLRHKGSEEQKILLDAQRALTLGNQKRAEIASGLEAARVELARLETRRDALERELQTDVSEAMRQKVRSGGASSDVVALSSSESEELRHGIQNLRHQLELIGSIDDEVVKEYTAANDRYTFLETQIEDVTKTLASLTELLRELERTMEAQFSKQFGQIQETFTSTFAKLFGGGRGKIELVAEDQALDDNSETISYQLPPTTSVDNYGIIIEAQPPGKKVKSLAMLSGGEKALTAIALVAALIAVAPTPFVVLDEVDAALDEANSGRLSDIIAELSEETQFIVITHNRSTMHKAKMLYGITMGEDGASQALSLAFAQAEALAPAAHP